MKGKKKVMSALTLASKITVVMVLTVVLTFGTMIGCAGNGGNTPVADEPTQTWPEPAGYPEGMLYEDGSGLLYEVIFDENGEPVVGDNGDVTFAIAATNGLTPRVNADGTKTYKPTGEGFVAVGPSGSQQIGQSATTGTTTSVSFTDQLFGVQQAYAAENEDTYAMMQELLTLVNQAREEESRIDGIAREPLIWDETMYRLSQIRVSEAAQSYSHTRPNGQRSFTVFDENGISTSRVFAIENLNQYCDTVEDAMDSWMRSSGHRSTILSPDAQFYASSISYDEFGVIYWHQSFYGGIVSEAPAPSSIVSPESIPVPSGMYDEEILSSIAMDEVEVTPITEQTYTGYQVQPALTLVYDDAVLLSPGTDYTVAYANNIEPGEATATVTGVGGFTGTVELEFTIADKPEEATEEEEADEAIDEDVIENGTIVVIGDENADEGDMGFVEGDQIIIDDLPDVTVVVPVTIIESGVTYTPVVDSDDAITRYDVSGDAGISNDPFPDTVAGIAVGIDSTWLDEQIAAINGLRDGADYDGAIARVEALVTRIGANRVNADATFAQAVTRLTEVKTAVEQAKTAAAAQPEPEPEPYVPPVNGGNGNGRGTTEPPAPTEPEMVQVPNVLSMTEADARAAIIAAGLAVGDVYYVPGGQNRVYRTNPPWGIYVPRGTAIGFAIK